MIAIIFGISLVLSRACGSSCIYLPDSKRLIHDYKLHLPLNNSEKPCKFSLWEMVIVINMTTVARIITA